jgi:GDP-L-fucose synthase
VDRQTVLLTGGGGMVGRNILEHPDAADWRFIAPSSRTLDLTDFDATRRFFDEQRPDIVVHCAGHVGGIQANMANPVDFLVTNTDLARNVILAARDCGVTRLVNLASSCMYPRHGANPLSEDTILTGELEPTNEGYALAKIFSMRLCQYIAREDPKRQYKTIVPCNIYGAHDKFSPQHSHLIPAIIHKVHAAKLEGRTEVDIWGDGTARREFMYAGDLAHGVLRALRHFETLPDVINFGLGHDFSIGEYYNTVARAIGWSGQFVHDMTKPVGMKRKQVDVSRQQAWGWMPSTSLDAGVKATYAYYLRSLHE